MPRPPHIVFAGGSTPGHLHPGLAVAARLIERIPEAVVTFTGGGHARDRQLIRAAGFKFAGMPSQPAPESVLRAVRFVTDNLAGYWAARWFLKEKRVSAVVGLGGASCAPAVRAAIARGLPTIVLEQNVTPGRVTRWLASSASMVCAGFQETRNYFPSAVPLAITGNPARPAFEQLYRTSHIADPPQREKRLVVIGGAGGSRSINENMPGALARLRNQLAGWQIIHQSGEGQLQQTESRYRAAGVDALVVAFIDEIAPIMFASDLVVCRPGGTTLAELALAGLPAILVPYPRVMDYHLPNAEVFAAAGAATLIDETEIPDSLETAMAERLEPLIVDDSRRTKMAANMRRLARPSAAANVTDVIHDALFGNAIRLAA